MKEALLIAPWAAVSFLSLAIAARFLRRSWLAPGAFFALYWCVAAVTPLIFAPHEKISAKAIVWILFSTLTVLLGDLAATINRPNRQVLRGNVMFSGSQVTSISAAVICCSVVGIVSFVMVLDSAVQANSALQDLSSLLSIENLQVVARTISASRYQTTYKSSITQFLNTFLYAGPMFGGLLVAMAHRRRYMMIAALSLLPSLLMTALFTLRGFVVISIFLWISSYLSMRVLLGDYQLFTKRHLVVALLIVVPLLIIVIGAGFARTSSSDRGSLTARSYAKIHKVAFGHIAVFSEWFDSRGLEVERPLPGAYTFAGVFDLLGIRKREVSLFTERVHLSNGKPSNIFTVFRPLMEDFTPPGSLVVLFLFGFVGSRVYQRLVQARAGTMPILVTFYASVLWSFVTCIWIWNSIIAAFILFAAGFLIMLDLHIVKSLPGTLYSRFKK